MTGSHYFFDFFLQQTEAAVEIAQRKNMKDIVQILQQYNHKSPRTLVTLPTGTKYPGSSLPTGNPGNPGKYPEKSVDDTTEEEFDVDAIMKDPTYNTLNNNDYKNSNKRDQRSSSSSKENHQQHHQRPPPSRSKRNSDARRQKYKKSRKVSTQIRTKETSINQSRINHLFYKI